MPNPIKDILPNWKSGDPLTAEDLMKLVGAIKALVPAHPSGFVNGAFSVSRQVHNDSIIEVVVYNKPDAQGHATTGPAIPGATWDKDKVTKTNTVCEFPVWYGAFADNTETFNKDNTFRFMHTKGKDLIVTAGKFRIGTVSDGILSQLDCVEFDLPASFTS